MFLFRRADLLLLFACRQSIILFEKQRIERMCVYMKKIVAILLACVLACGFLAGCADSRDGELTSDLPETDGELTSDLPEMDGSPLPPVVGSTARTIGISMPDESAHWKEEAEIMESALKAAGYNVTVCYAENDTYVQNNQVMDLIRDCQLLIIAAVDGLSLSSTLFDAEQAQVPVIAYDTLIMNALAVNYYVTFDYYGLGKQIAEYIFDQLNIYSTGGPYTIELAAGDPEDELVERMFTGAMDQFLYEVNDGKLIIKSNQFDYSQVAAGDAEGVRQRMDKILSVYYSDGAVPDVILCTDDAVAREVTAMLAERDTDSWPIITGEGCELENVKNIYNGKQSMSLYKDRPAMAQRTAEVAIAVLTGEKLFPDDETSYDNGNKTVPTFLEQAEIISKDNLYDLFDKGVYPADLFR